MELHEHDDQERFAPPSAAPSEAEGTYESGIVEVEFASGVQPQIVAAPSGDTAPAIESAVAELSQNLNPILVEHGLRQATLVFDVPASPPPGAAEAAAQQLPEGAELPDLSSFVTLEFGAETDVMSVVAQLNELPEVVRASRVPTAIPPAGPLTEPLVGNSDQVVLNPTTGFENQWYAFRTNTNLAWANVTGGAPVSGAGVVIADIDWGYRVTHEDLVGKLDMGLAYNSFDGSSDVSVGGSISHGTAVMGIAGAAVNDEGMAGLGYGASLWPIQANTGNGTPLGGNAWALAIDRVRQTGAGGRRKVIILEVQTAAFGNYEQVLSVNAAIRAAITAGVVVCVAAGNGNRDASLSDGGAPITPTGSILVGATAYSPSDNPRAGFSNWGPNVVVAAPGDGSHDLTCSSNSDAAYRNGFGGTSGATPKVAAVTALLLQIDPSLTHAQIRAILNQSGSTVTTAADRPVGTFLNAVSAVNAVQSPGIPGAYELLLLS